jgi:hypothetical protein
MNYKLIRTGKGLFTGGAQAGGKDSCGGGVIGNDIHIFGGTDNANTFNSHFKSTDGGQTFIALANAPWADRNEMGYVSANGKIYIWGGKSSGGANYNDSWYYNGVTWVQITAAMTGFGARQLFTFFYKDGYFYTIGGGVDGIIKSADLITWTTVTPTLPASISAVVKAACCVFKGAVYLTGGDSPGSSSLWKSTDNGVTWTPVLTDATMFPYEWNMLGANDEVMLFIKGTNGAANQFGSYVSYDGATFEQLLYNHEVTHAATVFTSADRSKIWIVQGNSFTGSCWKLVNVTA